MLGAVGTLGNIGSLGLATEFGGPGAGGGGGGGGTFFLQTDAGVTLTDDAAANKLTTQ
jgi:hypothetical protein